MSELSATRSLGTTRRMFLVAFVVAVALASPVLTGSLTGGSVGGVTGELTTAATLGSSGTIASPVPLEPSSAASLADPTTSQDMVPSAGSPITVHDVPLHLAGPRPSLWGPGDVPPGAPFAISGSAQVHDEPTASFLHHNRAAAGT